VPVFQRLDHTSGTWRSTTIGDRWPPLATPSQARGVGVLLRLPLYRKMVLLAMLILGSHAMHDSFAIIRWSRA
jgi:PPP family 3-phenylpropionic acid transporter